VIRTDFEEAGWGASALRIGFRLIASFLTLGLLELLNLAWILWDRDRQALHDKVAHTWVVNVDRAPASPYQALNPDL
ncbi:MAG: RDD family protein, partial [Actinobacteria bacterium]|nr:RDD family protein [Actinomycetota bacterium]